jgi:hypothetical protein
VRCFGRSGGQESGPRYFAGDARHFGVGDKRRDNFSLIADGRDLAGTAVKPF